MSVQTQRKISTQELLSSSFPRRRESSGFKQKAFSFCWIPAYAGMTAHLVEQYFS